MAQESISINKSLLKHLRKQKGEKQEITAILCHIGYRQYQNIEKDGRTTNKVIQSIALHFDTSADELINNKKVDDSLWYVTNPHFLVGNIEQGHYKAIGKITKKANCFHSEMSVRLSIKNEKQSKEITLFINDDEFCWNLRPVRLDKKIGLLWDELTEWQQYVWNDSLDELLYACVYEVYIDGKPLVPINITPQFMVVFKEVGDNKVIDKGYRIFNADSEFRVSLSEWLDSLAYPIPPTRSQKGSLNMIYDFENDKSKSITISRIWLDDTGMMHRAPWPSANIDKVIKAITDLEDGRRRWALPIGIGESLEEQNIPSMTPEVICNEITELPEINFTFKNEQPR
jgi:transcriptional regulator with XRE-family HTH domain